jgi:branched-chain amino acid transport system ATP-binding protein
MSLLEIERLTAGYGEAVVLEEMSLSVSEGECLAVLGRNGVDKSTLMLAIMAHAARFAGRLRWDGHDFSTLSTNQRVGLGLGWVPQEREIFPSLTVEENLTVAARPGHWDLAATYRLFPRLAERRRHMGNHLSGGEQQMLAIARALTTNPALLLLDEPLEGLAPIIVDELADAIGRMIADEGTAIILVEQHTDLALSLAREAVVIERGTIVLRGLSQDLLTDQASLDRLIGLNLTATDAAG